MRRRQFLRAMLLSFSAPAMAGRAAAHVAVVGGGFGGMAALRKIRLHADQAKIRITLVEPHPVYFGCPAANLVVAGFRKPDTIRHPRKNVSWDQIHSRAARIESGKCILRDGAEFRFDRAVVAPGVALDFAAMPGFSRDQISVAPHAWTGGGDGAQVRILRDQLRRMPAGGVFVVLPPPEPHSCPPAPYERASLAAAFFKKAKPRAKILIIDPKEKFAKQALFAGAWRKLGADMIEWRGGEAGGIVEALDLRDGRKIVETEFGPERADVLNYIPPQRAAALAMRSGMVDDSGWCPVRAATMESRALGGVHVVGDAAATAMPKSASAAESQGVAAAVAILREFGIGGLLENDILSSACYSLASPAHGVASEARFRADDGEWKKVGERLTPPDADDSRLRRAAQKADEWHSRIIAELFG